MNIIEAKSLRYSYDNSARLALNEVSLTVAPGELVAILGRNGSGKTTFACHLNALLPVQSGELTVTCFDARDEQRIWQIRKSCGMVFQNPDNQFVSSNVEEELAFGMRNFGVSEESISERVSAALAEVGLAGFERRAPQLLSGGQKQRVAIAAVLATDPDIMVFDEATSMLDPQGRSEVLDTIRKLHERGKTIVMISHYIEEAVMADKVVLLDGGRKIAEGSPREVLTQPELMAQAGLSLPFPVRVYYDLAEAGVKLDTIPLTIDELVEEVCR